MKTNIKIGNRIKAVDCRELGPSHRDKILNKTFICLEVYGGRGGNEYVTVEQNDGNRLTYFAWRFIQSPSLNRRCYGKQN